jgi:hypothetical protein
MLAWTGTASAAPVNLSLDGFCDQLAITLSNDSNGNKIFAALNENAATCTADLMTGFVVKIKGYTTRWVYVGGPRFGDGTGWGFIFSYPFVTGGTWALYNTVDGATISVADSGTYTRGPSHQPGSMTVAGTSHQPTIRSDVPSPEALRR